MQKNAAAALVISCALHAAVFLSFRAERAPVRVARPRPVELELRQVEARRGPPAIEHKKRASKRPPAARTNAPVPVSPLVDEGLPVPPSGPPGDEPGDEPGDDPGGSESGDPEGLGVPPPPPPPDTRAEVLWLPRVEYPLEAREEGVEGVVRLRVRLDAHGKVISVEVREEPGSGLGEVARRALLGASFRAATHLGAGVESSFEYVYRFELR